MKGRNILMFTIWCLTVLILFYACKTKNHSTYAKACGAITPLLYKDSITNAFSSIWADYTWG